MIFIETTIFTREIQGLLPDDSYRELQQALPARPEAGMVIPGSGGVRKLRWNHPGIGKRKSLRIIYYWDISSDTIYMLLPYKKSRQDDLTHDQIKSLIIIVKERLQ